MKNDECEVRIILPSGWTQTWRKKGTHWEQTTNGIPRVATSEQFLSHILPLLVEGQTRARVIVVPDK